jgi:spermidine synthase
MSAFVPLYGSLWLMAIASDALDPCACSAQEMAARIDTRGIDALRYYGAALHPALFVLPGTVRAQLDFD